MNYKTATLSIFVVLMLLTVYLIFGETKWGLAIIGLIVPLIVVVQVLVVLLAKNGGVKHDEPDGYEER